MIRLFDQSNGEGIPKGNAVIGFDTCNLLRMRTPNPRTGKSRAPNPTVVMEITMSAK